LHNIIQGGEELNSRTITLDKDWNKSRFVTCFVFVFMLTMIDYILTYIGIVEHQVIREMNPFMVWLFNLPFEIGFMVRLLMVSVVMQLINYIYSKDRKKGQMVITLAIIANMAPVFAHTLWISYYSFLFF
jgi:hypothetical protein